VLPITGSDTEGLVVVSGAYKGLALFLDASRDGATYFAVFAYGAADLSRQVCYPSGFAVPDGATLAFRVHSLQGVTALRVWAFSLTSGPVNVQMASGSWYDSPPY
jgi:hypothetical protein